MTKVDPEKGSAQQDNEDPKCAQDRHDDIRKICFALSGSTSSFHSESVYEDIRSYKNTHGRWFYSDISNYLFSAATEDNGVFISNLEKLQGYAYKYCKDEQCKEEKDRDPDAEQLTVMVDKLWDHANLAQKQIDSLRQGEDEFQNKFEANIAPHITKLTEDMNKQLISLVSIFTALSFIIFGGISSLDNIFYGAQSIPIIQLVIIGCIWGICILNLVFTFSFLVSKLTKLSIKSCEDSNASLSQKYPFWVWSNYVLLLILSMSCLLYFLSFSGSNNWIIAMAKHHPILSTIIGALLVIVVFASTFAILRKKSDRAPD